MDSYFASKVSCSFDKQSKQSRKPHSELQIGHLLSMIKLNNSFIDLNKYDFNITLHCKQNVNKM